ncbi:uncharacterized protein LY79DRAFT_536142 [Colletotrichum navitas]|uniref:Uncharacterized protein n=1 Tax=Colletotrichum navitas TaxID=681940 RepID=A0AAD8QEC7_9PEZI|nr:uncharacterized protein LY79DRAFT_536142 [Colletotrichum navitas]KAK1599803.1 hypothetical protein LY79DRAFT_536142 [Colletotrichum navitas]
MSPEGVCAAAALRPVGNVLRDRTVLLQDELILVSALTTTGPLPIPRANKRPQTDLFSRDTPLLTYPASYSAMLRRPREAWRLYPRSSAPPITPAVSAVGRLPPGKHIEPSVTHQQHSPDPTVRKLVVLAQPPYELTLPIRHNKVCVPAVASCISLPPPFLCGTSVSLSAHPHLPRRRL